MAHQRELFTRAGAGRIVVVGREPGNTESFGERLARLVVAADAGSIAAATASLLADAAARSALGRRARAFVEAHHGWDAYGRRPAQTYAELIAPGPLDG